MNDTRIYIVGSDPSRKFGDQLVAVPAETIKQYRGFVPEPDGAIAADSPESAKAAYCHKNQMKALRVA